MGVHFFCIEAVLERPGRLGLAYFSFFLRGRPFLGASSALASSFFRRPLRTGAGFSWATLTVASTLLYFFMRRALRRATFLGWSAPFWAARSRAPMAIRTVSADACGSALVMASSARPTEVLAVLRRARLRKRCCSDLRQALAAERLPKGMIPPLKQTAAIISEPGCFVQWNLPEGLLL